jgi:superfamily II DNA helicase RecQ
MPPVAVEIKKIIPLQIRIFNIPLTDNGEAQSELNRFLAGHKVLEVEQRFFQNEKGGCWSFCVRHLGAGLGSVPAGGYAKVDYREVLSETEFTVFSRLRAIRKQLSQEDGVPAYAVFTDEELAGISRLPELSESKLKTIEGIGDKKAAKYGKIMLDRYNKTMNRHEA